VRAEARDRDKSATTRGTRLLEPQIKLRLIRAVSVLLRWVRSPVQRTYEWQLHSSYWCLRSWWGSLRFFLAKVRHSIRGAFRSGRESSSIWLALGSLAMRRMVFVLAGLAAVYAVEVLLIPRLLPNVWPSVARGGTETTAVSAGPIRVSASSYVAILSTLAQIAGISLALYFTAMSVVASRAYAEVPRDVRQLLLSERVGNRYVGNVALAAAVSIALLVANAFGLPPSAIGLGVVSILGIVSVYSVARLAERVFHFLDPTLLSAVMVRDILGHIRDVSAGGLRWLDPSYQDFYRRKARNCLGAYLGVAELARKKEAYGEGLLDMALDTLRLLAFYSKQKSSIPSDSYWFARVARYGQWFTGDFTKVDIALTTRTMLKPEGVADLVWFEEQTGRIVADAADTFAQRGDLDRARNVCMKLHGGLREMAKNGAMEEALALHHEIESVIKRCARDKSLSGVPSFDDARRQALILSTVETYWLGLVNVLLGLSDHLKNTTADSITKTLGRIHWRRARTMYSHGLPRLVLKRIEDLRDRLEFERSVEGRIVSPAWYIRECVAESYAEFIRDARQRVMAGIEGRLAAEAETLMEEGFVVPSVQVTVVGLQACNKLEHHVKVMRHADDEMQDMRNGGSKDSPEGDWQQIVSRVKGLRKRLVVNLAKTLPILANMQRPATWPDYFGQGYSIIAEECYQSIASGNDEQFEKVFPLFFMAAMAAVLRLGAETSGYEQRAAVAVSSDPLVDLLELSGHALIASELDAERSKLWSAARSCWDEFFEKHPDASVAVKFILATVGVRDSTTLLPWTARYMERTKWQQDLSRRLRERGLIEDYAGFRAETYVPKHQSPIIRVIAQGGDFLFYEPKDVFLAEYLAKRAEASGMQAPRKAQDFAQSIARQRSSCREKNRDNQ